MRRAPRVVLAVLLAAVAGACTNHGADGGGRAGGGVGGAPAVTVDESREVLRDWTDRHDRAVTSGDRKLWRDTVTGGLEGPVTARVHTYGRLPKSATISLVNPVLYVPRRSAYPRWFAVAALERSGGKDQQVLGVFVRTGAKDPWRAAHWLTFQGRPPELAYDAEGYAIPAPDRGLPAAHAAYLASGDDGGVIPDAFTVSARRPDTGDWKAGPGKVAAGPGAAYALRTKDGGSLVLYGLRQDQTLTGGKEATLPGEVNAYLAKDGKEPDGAVRASWQWLVIGYAPVTGKARVLGESVSLASAGAGG